MILFDDMADFVSKVRMEADFNEADLDSDDIAFFAPAMQNWKKKIRISGKIKGPVENLTARKLIVEAGKTRTSTVISALKVCRISTIRSLIL
ncbi:hypothetical protein [Paraflavitalea speifideaquila]|uniref:hypothetical protein n=1 Tax=Paraflavitalea speifideaquila TaxID=3076558 RepID=UPI0028EBD4D5|nr:hypothetical protein [Paraflavitalea speifideiaquila]